MKKTLLLTLLCLPLTALAEVKTIKDVLGREVKVNVPVKRAVLGFYYPDYIAATGTENFNRVVGISREFWEKLNPGSWNLFVKKMPRLKNIGDIGNVDTGTFSLEKTLSLKPDVLILADWQYKALSQEIPKIQAAGIPIVVVDYNAQTVEKHVRSTEIFGELAGTEKRAKQVASEYAEGIADIRRRVARAKQAKPKIYIEFGNKGPSEYSFTFGKNMWGAIADAAGGNNVSAKYIKNWGPINPELLLVTRPEVVIISGNELGHDKNPAIMAMGIGINEADAQKRLAGFVRRKGWSDFPAVKNKRIYGAYHTASRSITDLASIQFVAKSLYPAQFADINPNKTYTDFYRKYLPVVPQGTFYTQLK